MKRSGTNDRDVEQVAFRTRGSHVKIRSILATSLVSTLAATVAADKIDDPMGMSTHSVNSNTSFFTIHDSQSIEYTTPSQESQRLSSMVGGVYCARMGVTDSSDSEKYQIDKIVFDWCNRELFSPFGMSAYGTTSVNFDIQDDAMISLGLTPDSSLLAGGAGWDIRLTDASGILIGAISEDSQPFLLQAGGNYTIEFSMNGDDTRTLGGATLEWGVEMAYASSPAVVPGAGGLALCLGFGGRRRRRRRI
jgi:hypothetical protein